jgi:putative endonuclease
MLYRVYVIQNPRNAFYVGLSENVEARLAQHNSGESKWTKGKGPWQLLWVSEERSLSEARKLENLLKRQKGGAGFYTITGLERAGS